MEVTHALKTGKININNTMYETTEGTEFKQFYRHLFI